MSVRAHIGNHALPVETKNKKEVHTVESLVEALRNTPGKLLRFVRTDHGFALFINNRDVTNKAASLLADAGVHLTVGPSVKDLSAATQELSRLVGRTFDWRLG